MYKHEFSGLSVLTIRAAYNYINILLYTRILIHISHTYTYTVQCIHILILSFSFCISSTPLSASFPTFFCNILQVQYIPPSTGRFLKSAIAQNLCIYLQSMPDVAIALTLHFTAFLVINAVWLSLCMILYIAYRKHPLSFFILNILNCNHSTKLYIYISQR